MTFVICAICGLHGKSLGKHVSDMHEMRPKEYAELYGQLKCQASFEVYSQQNKYNCNWIARANETGKDLTDYKQKMSESVSRAIMSNPDERARRAELLGNLNRTDAFRQKSSETAIKTSARPEILAARTERLQHWRETNFEEFYEKCVKSMLSTWHSKPEIALFEIVKNIDGYSFKNNQFLKSETFVKKSKRKQIDIADHNLRVYIEFDGPHHFRNIHGVLSDVQQSDRLLDEYIKKQGWTLIRISLDQWKSGKFKDECLKCLFDALKNPCVGVLKIGKLYENA